MFRPTGSPYGRTSAMREGIAPWRRVYTRRSARRVLAAMRLRSLLIRTRRRHKTGRRGARRQPRRAKREAPDKIGARINRKKDN